MSVITWGRVQRGGGIIHQGLHMGSTMGRFSHLLQWPCIGVVPRSLCSDVDHVDHLGRVDCVDHVDHVDHVNCVDHVDHVDRAT